MNPEEPGFLFLIGLPSKRFAALGAAPRTSVSRLRSPHLVIFLPDPGFS